MATQGPLYPGTCADDSAVGTQAWTNESNAGASDDMYAVAQAGIMGGETTHYLKVTNFGFSILGTPTGITVEIERNDDGGFGTITDVTVKLVVGGSVVGDNKASGSAWPDADGIATYGGAADLWGLTPSQGEVNASNFGVVLSCTIGGSLQNAKVDFIRVTVDYNATIDPIPPMDSVQSAAAMVSTVLHQHRVVSYG